MGGRSKRRFRFSIRLYAALIRAFPHSFHAYFGSELVEDFADLLNDRCRGGPVTGRFSSWLTALCDLGISVPRAHFRDLGRRTAPWARANADRIARPWTGLRLDVRSSVRALARAPRFTVLAVATLGLGIGATGLVFSLFNAVVLHPLPFHDASRLVRMRELTPDGEEISVSDPNFLDFERLSESVLEMAAYSSDATTIVSEGLPQQTVCARTTPDLFSLLGATPFLGHDFAEDDALIEAQTGPAVIGYEIWKRMFGADPSVLGQTVLVDGVEHSVVGVMPPQFRFPEGTEVWIPTLPDRNANRAEHRLVGLGRLEQGVSLEQARAELQGIAAQLSDQYPQSNNGYGIVLMSFRDWLVGPGATRIAAVLLGAAVCLLCMCYVSVSNLIIARGTTRKHEVAIRVAIGGSRRRVSRQFITEGLLLALLGAALGALLMSAAVPATRALMENALPRLDEVSVNRAVIVFMLLVALLTGLLCGVPSIAVLSDGERREVLNLARTTRVRTHSRVPDGLVVSQLALTMTLLLGAGLLAKSFVRMLGVDPRYEVAGVVAFRVSFPGNRFPPLSSRSAAGLEEILERVRRVPGVSDVGASLMSVLNERRPSNYVGLLEERDQSVQQSRLVPVRWTAVTPGFFSTLGVDAMDGRVLDETDRVDASPFSQSPTSDADLSVVINESLAGRLLPQGHLVGRKLAWSVSNGLRVRIVGVVPDIRDVAYPHEPEATVYMPHSVAPWPVMTMFVRSDSDVSLLAEAIRKEIWAVDGQIAISELQELATAVRTVALSGPRLTVLVTGVFALCALLLGVLGVYGVTSIFVARRTREIGLQLALGARPATVMLSILSRSFKLAVVGICIGSIAGVVLLSLCARAVLFGVSPTDAATYCTMAFVVAATVLTASYLPARRAARVDPRIAIVAE